MLNCCLSFFVNCFHFCVFFNLTGSVRICITLLQFSWQEYLYGENQKNTILYSGKHPTSSWRVSFVNPVTSVRYFLNHWIDWGVSKLLTVHIITWTLIAVWTIRWVDRWNWVLSSFLKLADVAFHASDRVLTDENSCLSSLTPERLFMSDSDLGEGFLDWNVRVTAAFVSFEAASSAVYLDWRGVRACAAGDVISLKGLTKLLGGGGLSLLILTFRSSHNQAGWDFGLYLEGEHFQKSLVR